MSTIRLSIVGDCLISIDDSQLTTSASHLFGLGLLLTLERRRWFSRQDLYDFLFLATSNRQLTSHRLRQLLYRLRRLAVPLDERASSIRLGDCTVVGPIETLRELSPSQRAHYDVATLRVLPAYAPPLPAAYLEWLDSTRDAIDSEIRQLLLADLASLRSTHSWDELALISETLGGLDPLNETVAIAAAEALAMKGERQKALSILDAFRENLGGSTPEGAAIRRLRGRIIKSTRDRKEEPFFGRQDCLALLADEWQSASSGGARLVTIVGPAGLGKTRLASEFATSVALSGGLVIQHRCDVSSRGFPLSLLSHLLPHLQTMRGSIGISPQHQTSLDLLRPSHRASATPIPSGVALEVVRADLQSAIVDLLEATSSEQQLLIIVDDAHLLDDASTALLHSLGHSVNSAALLFVACCRTSDQGSHLLAHGERARSALLLPLSEEDSRALFHSIAPGAPVAQRTIDECVAQSAGNPFYLCALARHSQLSTATGGAPPDIDTLASASYLALADTDRLVLESCLLLGRFATLHRIGLVTALDDLALAKAMRHLEAQELVSLVADTVRGPHSLLDDAIRVMIPKTVCALLHKQVARVLSAECTLGEYSPSLALAAAGSWLAAGDTAAALVLTQRCAAEAASIGEPAAAADLLAQMVQSVLPEATRRRLLDDLIAYADAGGSRVLVAKSLRDRLALARSARDSELEIRRLDLRIIEADIHNGSDLQSAVPALTHMLSNPESDYDTRMKCIVTLMVIADAEYDSHLAGWLYESMATFARHDHRASADELRARVVFHTTFGQLDHALDIVRDLVSRFSTPTLEEECRTARRFASYALYRMMMPAQARPILEADYAFMSAHSIRSEALYSASLLTEIAIGEGNFEVAAIWFAETEKQLRGATAHQLSPNSGYYSSAALFAMMRGDYEEAQRLITTPQAEDSRMRTARYDAICSALRLRLHISQGEASSHPELVARLSDLYSRGQALGGQDSIVEMLWSAYVLSGKERKASALLTDYLSKHRREAFAPEWSLRQTTAADEAWIGAQRPDPEDINRKLLDLDFALSAGGNSQFQKSLASN